MSGYLFFLALMAAASASLLNVTPASRRARRATYPPAWAGSPMRSIAATTWLIGAVASWTRVIVVTLRARWPLCLEWSSAARVDVAVQGQFSHVATVVSSMPHILLGQPAPLPVGHAGQPSPENCPRGTAGSHGQVTLRTTENGLFSTITPARARAGAGAGQADRPTCPRPRHPEGGAGAEGSRRAPGLNATRKAIRTQCPTCGSEVLAGLDADAMAGEAVIDPDPIGLDREVTELEAGHPTYTYDHMTRRIDYRDRGSLSNPLRLPVHPTHTCQEH